MSGFIDFYCERFVCICTRCCTYGAFGAHLALRWNWRGTDYPIHRHTIRNEKCRKCGTVLASDAWTHTHKYGATITKRAIVQKRKLFDPIGNAMIAEFQKILDNTASTCADHEFNLPNNPKGKGTRQAVSKLGVVPNVNLFAKL